MLSALSLLLALGSVLPAVESLPSISLPSRFKCTSEGRPGAHCLFENVYLYNATLFYLHTEPVELPKLKLYHAPIPDGSDLLERSLVPLAAHEAPWEAEDLAEAQVLERGVLWYWVKMGNMYHQVMETGQMLHNLLCEVFRFCSVPSKRTDVTLLSLKDFWYDDRREDGSRYPFDDILRCFTRQPVTDLRAPQWAGRLVIFRQLAVGLGMNCSIIASCDPRDIASTVSMRALLEPYLGPGRVEGYRRRLHQCTGLDPTRRADTAAPQVRLVNREQAALRTFLNARAMPSLVAAATGHRPRIVHLEGRSLEQTAALMHRTDVLLTAHGAALAWTIFLPLNAVVVEIVPHGGEWIYQESYGWIIEAAYGAVTGYRHRQHALPTPGHTRYRPEVLLADPRYPKLSRASKLRLWEEGRCPRGTGEIVAHCRNAWALRGADWLLDGDKLAASVTDAVALVLEKGGAGEGEGEGEEEGEEEPEGDAGEGDEEAA